MEVTNTQIGQAFRDRVSKAYGVVRGSDKLLVSGVCDDSSPTTRLSFEHSYYHDHHGSMRWTRDESGFEFVIESADRREVGRHRFEFDVSADQMVEAIWSDFTLSIHNNHWRHAYMISGYTCPHCPGFKDELAETLAHFDDEGMGDSAETIKALRDCGFEVVRQVSTEWGGQLSLLSRPDGALVAMSTTSGGRVDRGHVYACIKRRSTSSQDEGVRVLFGTVDHHSQEGEGTVCHYFRNSRVAEWLDLLERRWQIECWTEEGRKHLGFRLGQLPGFERGADAGRRLDQLKEILSDPASPSWAKACVFGQD